MTLHSLKYFVYIHTLFMQATHALVRLRICADLCKPSLLIDVMIAEILCAGHWPLYLISLYSKTSVKWSHSNRQKIGFQYQLSLNAGHILQYF